MIWLSFRIKVLGDADEGDRAAKRLFGVRGGYAAERAERAEDEGWQALERSGPPSAEVPAALSAQ